MPGIGICVPIRKPQVLKAKNEVCRVTRSLQLVLTHFVYWAA